jgi:hypothetical protein
MIEKSDQKSYYRTQGHIGHFTVRTDNPVEIIRIVKHPQILQTAYSPDSALSENLNSHVIDSQVRETKKA